MYDYLLLLSHGIILNSAVSPAEKQVSLHLAMFLLLHTDLVLVLVNKAKLDDAMGLRCFMGSALED